MICRILNNTFLGINWTDLNLKTLDKSYYEKVGHFVAKVYIGCLPYGRRNRFVIDLYK